ncbi:hypothetical protein [Pedobacter sp. L105]|uniref:hypothetical protein n=1 Tax=Pedobacter sp. L105 TaxID=1641871 RepID=UPI00131A9DF2|nr:hypothetical protein [Pedobacter sp. L105]
MEDENEIDQLFKRGLSDPEIPFNELDWEKMERKLDAQEKKRILPLWIFMAGGIAAALLIFLSLFFLTPVFKGQPDTKTSLANHTVKQKRQNELPLTVKENDTLNKMGQPRFSDEENAAVLSAPSQITPSGQPAVNPSANVFAGIKPLQPTEVKINRTDAFSAPVNTNAPQTAVVYPKVQQLLPETVKERKDPVISIPAIAPQTASVDSKPHQVIPETDSARVVRTANALAQSKDPFEKIDKTEIERSIKKKMDAALQQQGHNLVLTAMAAPDISTANSSKSSKVSSDLGMVASYAVWDKVSVSSGAIYAKKYYNYSNNYDATNQVNADCNVLDIPLNVNYKLMNKKQLAISMTAGVSSYFMLKEKYEYINGSGASQTTTTQVIDNQNQHIFGVANLGVNFNHQITQSMSIGVQPFAKLPLTGIGEHDANLKSIGMFFSLNIGLFGPKKPGKYASTWK